MEEKKTRIKNLSTKLSNANNDRDVVQIDNIFLDKQRDIYCNTTKRLYRKLIALYHLYDICKEQHIQLFPFITFKELVDILSYECEI